MEVYNAFLAHNAYPRVFPKVTGLNFSSNDYLGLSKHPLLIARSQEYAEKWGVGAASSRLVAGNIPIYDELEAKLARFLRKPAALILASGYQTNTSVLEALLDPGILGQKAHVFCDRFCHNSLLAMTRHISHVHRFQHNDLSHLKRLLDQYANDASPRFIIIESLYSMEGDQADLPGVIALAKHYNAMLYVDDAHAVGIYGKEGAGLTADYPEIDVVMGTFSKAMGSFGGYVATSLPLKNYLINRCKGLIYSTGLSPAILGAIAGALECVPKMQQERTQLWQKVDDLRQFFLSENMDIGRAHSPILPWIVGEANKTLLLSAKLKEQGIHAVTIRPPSVPYGKSRIRFCLSVSHRAEDIARLKESVAHVKRCHELF